MSDAQLLQFLSATISVVLSHQHQKDDTRAMTHNTPVSFSAVRDVMYKYSKKAEAQFFSQSTLGFFI
jgi:hypothetical protein